MLPSRAIFQGCWAVKWMARGFGLAAASSRSAVALSSRAEPKMLRGPENSRADRSSVCNGAPFAQAGDRDGRVHHLRAADAGGSRARDQIAQGRHLLVERQAIGVVDGRRHQAAASQRDRPADVDRRRWLRRAVDPEAVELRNLAKRQRDRLQ